MPWMDARGQGVGSEIGAWGTGGSDPGGRMQLGCAGGEG